MAHQDYVARKRAPNKKSNPYKGKAEPEKSGISLKNKIIGATTLLALLVFAVGLWSLKHGESAKVNLPVPDKAAQQSKESTLPKPPEEKWSYMEDLKNKQVEEGHYDVETAGPYQMQCGSFRTEHQAETLKAKIAFVGIEAKIRQSQGKNGLWYKVVLGPYQRKRLAENDKHKLKSNSVNGCQIWLWQ